MTAINGFTLLNKGGFVCRLHMLVRQPTGMPGAYEEEKLVEDNNDIHLGSTKESDIGWPDYHIKEGALVRMKVWVMAGKDAVASDTFVYKAGAGIADYVITGTTLDNQLGLMRHPK